MIIRNIPRINLSICVISPTFASKTTCYETIGI